MWSLEGEPGAFADAAREPPPASRRPRAACPPPPPADPLPPPPLSLFFFSHRRHGSLLDGDPPGRPELHVHGPGMRGKYTRVDEKVGTHVWMVGLHLCAAVFWLNKISTPSTTTPHDSLTFHYFFLLLNRVESLGLDGPSLPSLERGHDRGVRVWGSGRRCVHHRVRVHR